MRSLQGEHTAIQLEALLHASRELGPDLDQALIASYLTQEHLSPVGAHRLARALPGRRLLSVPFAPVYILGGNVLASGALQLFYPTGFVTTPQGNVWPDGTMVILFAVNLTCWLALLAVLGGLRCVDLTVNQDLIRLRQTLRRGMETAGGAMLCTVLGLVIAHQRWWQRDPLVWSTGTVLVLTAALLLATLLAALLCTAPARLLHREDVKLLQGL
jgi:hypothetical protein